MMKEYKLSESTLQFLIANLSDEKIRQELLKAKDDNHIRVHQMYPTGAYSIQLESSETQKIVDELSNMLTEVGLDDDDEPNETGIRIENMIDTFV